MVNINFRRMLHTPIGIAFISILLGLGLATLFRKVCTDKSCITFNGPIISEVEGKTFKHDEKCYKYDVYSAKCDENRKIIDISAMEQDSKKGFFS